MFVAGGICFLLLGQLNRAQPRLPLLLRALAGAGIITMIEYAAGLVVNQNYAVWDYRGQPLNYHGQICFGFCLLWIPVAMGAMAIFHILDKKIPPVK